MPGTVVGVASERDVVVLDSRAAASDLLALLDERGVPGKQLHVFDDKTTVVISRENLHDEEQLRALIEKRFGSRAALIDGLAAVSVVGAGINATYRNVRTGDETLRAAGIHPRGTATSSFRITWMVPRERMEDAVRALHQRFVETEKPLVP
jgi:aspartate kinase